jgi:four helix bundle protein
VRGEEKNCGLRIADLGSRGEEGGGAKWTVRVESWDGAPRRSRSGFSRLWPGSRKTVVSDSIGYQLVRCGLSVGANYREANRAESRDDFIHKIGIIEKEASETCYWLELCEEAGIGDNAERQRLLKESSELLAIFTSIGKTAKSRYRKARA